MGDAISKVGLALARIAKIKVRDYKAYQRLLAGKVGIEIGGPSSFFSRKLPIYSTIGSLDNVNFRARTSWGAEQVEGHHFRYYRDRVGYQFIGDAVDLGIIESGRYDFVLSCHNLEHIANPLKALKGWMRITKPAGLVLLVLPNKKSNFDHNRPITQFDHLVEDLSRDTQEGDLSHLPEILALHDLSRDPGGGTVDQFRERSSNNIQFRCLHHHVFDMTLLRRIMGFLGLDIALSHSSRTEYVLLGQKQGAS